MNSPKYFEPVTEFEPAIHGWATCGLPIEPTPAFNTFKRFLFSPETKNFKTKNPS